MDYFYSPRTGGFYVREVHGNDMPDDVLPVSEELHAQLIAPPQGYQLGLDSEGRPALVERPEPPALVPAVVSRFQGREAMHQTAYGEGTLFDAAQAVIDHADTPAMYRRAWADLQEFRRDSEMLGAIAGALGLTAVQIDAVFILAASIQA
ncbi:hypothetical protein [Achromobacter sp. LC458]|uniref:hypothetical protein n=1 Tax=Achromobacter sp. LC458 TaxID=1120623 RepID=UPI000AEC5F0A|nr:hypothetical protein [Achromobacter sp. LC458]